MFQTTNQWLCCLKHFVVLQTHRCATACYSWASCHGAALHSVHVHPAPNHPRMFPRWHSWSGELAGNWQCLCDSVSNWFMFQRFDLILGTYIRYPTCVLKTGCKSRSTQQNLSWLVRSILHHFASWIFHKAWPPFTNMPGTGVRCLTIIIIIITIIIIIIITTITVTVIIILRLDAKSLKTSSTLDNSCNLEHPKYRSLWIHDPIGPGKEVLVSTPKSGNAPVRLDRRRSPQRPHQKSQAMEAWIRKTPW